MKLPEESAKRIVTKFTKEKLLEETVAKDVIDSLEKDKEVNWNIVLTKQFQSERKTDDETHS